MATLSERNSQTGLTRKEREQRFRVDLVLDAAWDVFAEKSFGAVTVEELAEAAEISVGTLYNLFDGKDELYSCLVSREQSRFFEFLHQRIDAAKGPNAQVHATVQGHFELFASNVKPWRLYASASNGFQWEAKQALADQVMRTHLGFVQRLARACEHGLDTKVFRCGIPAEVMAFMILAVPHSYLGYLFEHPETPVMSLLPSALQVIDRITGVEPA